MSETEKNYTDAIIEAPRGTPSYNKAVFYADEIMNLVNTFNIPDYIAQDVVMTALVSIIIQRIEAGLPESKNYSTPQEYMAIVNHCIKESVIKSLEINKMEKH